MNMQIYFHFSYFFLRKTNFKILPLLQPRDDNLKLTKEEIMNACVFSKLETWTQLSVYIYKSVDV